MCPPQLTPGMVWATCWPWYVNSHRPCWQEKSRTVRNCIVLWWRWVPVFMYKVILYIVCDSLYCNIVIECAGCQKQTSCCWQNIWVFVIKKLVFLYYTCNYFYIFWVLYKVICTCNNAVNFKIRSIFVNNHVPVLFRT